MLSSSRVKTSKPSIRPDEIIYHALFERKDKQVNNKKRDAKPYEVRVAKSGKSKIFLINMGAVTNVAGIINKHLHSG